MKVRLALHHDNPRILVIVLELVSGMDGWKAKRARAMRFRAHVELSENCEQIVTMI